MKRSTVNQILAQAREFIHSLGYRLPPFGELSPEEMIARREELSAVIDARLGWDITDYGAGRFDEMGLFLFTTRNGSPAELKTGGMCYAEKIMISRQNQVSPLHRHYVKTEDIINRGGANLAMRMFLSSPDGALDPDQTVTLMCDGVKRSFRGGETVLLKPGESVTLRPGNWHEFWGEGGDVLIGEVSSVNDDLTDNIFLEPISRFSGIEEDTKPDRLLVSDYDHWIRSAVQ